MGHRGAGAGGDDGPEGGLLRAQDFHLPLEVGGHLRFGTTPVPPGEHGEKGARRGNRGFLHRTDFPFFLPHPQFLHGVRESHPLPLEAAGQEAEHLDGQVAGLEPDPCRARAPHPPRHFHPFPIGDDDLRPADFLPGLLGIPPVGQKPRPFRRHQEGGVAAGKPAEVPDVRHSGAEEQVEPAAGQERHKPADAKVTRRQARPLSASG
jgi:hypothetical protein